MVLAARLWVIYLGFPVLLEQRGIASCILNSMDHPMEDNQKLAFWEVKWQSDSRRRQAKIVAIIGGVLLLVALSAKASTFWIVLACVSAMVVAGISSNSAIVEDYKPPEPKLELIDEKYKLKASGYDGINALALIAVFKEQEYVKSERLLMFIGAGFGIISLAIGIFSDNSLSILTSSVFALFFVAWASKVRSFRIKGFGVELASEHRNRKAN